MLKRWLAAYRNKRALLRVGNAFCYLCGATQATITIEDCVLQDTSTDEALGILMYAMAALEKEYEAL